MQLFIPACGDRIRLLSDWTFKLHDEHRNRRFAEVRLSFVPHGFGDRWKNNDDPIDITLPAGTVLECDRVYIRSNSKQVAHPDDTYDSITFKVVVDGKAQMKQRFWVKLSDANHIDFDLDSLYRDRKP
jgi:hypothetical protein